MTTNNHAVVEEKETATIRSLNDVFRSTSIVGGKTFVSQGVIALGLTANLEIGRKVRLFDDFNEDNDPHGKHDFGAFDVRIGDRVEKVFWKIDYYNQSYEFGSENPADPSVTNRVLTILLASEY